MNFDNWTAEDLERELAAKKPSKGRGRPASAPAPPPAPEPAPAAWVPFPTHLLPGPSAEFAAQGAGVINVDTSYVALPALTVLAACIGTTRTIYLRHKFVQPAALWTAYMGDSGSNKSGAYGLTMEHLGRRQMQWIDEYRDALAEWEVARQVVAETHQGADPLREPVLRQIWTTDSTIEGLTELMHSGNRGALLASAELTGFIEGLSRYKASSDRSKWLELYDGHCGFINRKNTKGVKAIRAAQVCIAGAIQPRIYDKTMTDEHLAAGLGARFLYAKPPYVRSRWHKREIAAGVEAGWESLCDSLLDLNHAASPEGSGIPLLCHLGAEAESLYGAWFDKRHERLESVKNPHLRSAWAKLFGQCGRLALVHHVCQATYQAYAGVPRSTDRVGADSMAAAIEMAEWFAAQAASVYGEEAVDVSLVAWVKGQGGRVTARDMVTSKRAATSAEAQAALQDLAAAQKGEWIREGKKDVFSLFEI